MCSSIVGCHPYLADGDPVKLLGALKNVRRMDASTFVPGHGPVGTKDDLDMMINYIEGCLEQAQTIVHGGDLEGGLSDLKIERDFENWLLPQFYEANIQFLCKYLTS